MPQPDHPLRGRDFLRTDDLTAGELRSVLDTADRLKQLQHERIPHALLPGRSLAMIFERSSTRTRVSFEVGIGQLGGMAVPLTASDTQLGRGESIGDTGRVLSRYVDAIVYRTASHERVQELAEAADVPVVNALSDLHHPCQSLADVQTLRERLGDLSGRRLTWLGDGHNNVCHSLLTAASLLGMTLVVGCPEGYDPDPLVLAAAGAEIVRDPAQAVAGAHAVATDVWASMGQEDDRERRLSDLAAFQVNAELLSGADAGHVVLHCLPAHPGEEITADVLYGPHSAAWDEAENRLHAQKALLAMVMP
ncbi:MAG: ornithine carbamoyltransferase [Gaiellales bacterium]